MSTLGTAGDLALCRAQTRETTPADADGPRAPLSAFTVLAVDGDRECFVGAANEYILARVIRARRRGLPSAPARFVRWRMIPIGDGGDGGDGEP